MASAGQPEINQSVVKTSINLSLTWKALLCVLTLTIAVLFIGNLAYGSDAVDTGREKSVEGTSAQGGKEKLTVNRPDQDMNKFVTGTGFSLYGSQEERIIKPWLNVLQYDSKSGLKVNNAY